MLAPESFRAALSRFMAGDVAGADTLFASFMADARKRNDPLADLRAVAWQWMTGRSPRDNPADPRTQVLKALWTLAKGDRDSARRFAGQAQSAARDSSEASLAMIAVLLAQPSATPAEWTARISRALPPQLAAMQGRRLLGWALLLDNKTAEAAQVWREIYDTAPVQSANTERMLLAWALVDSGQIAAARKVLPHGFFPPPMLDPGVDLLLYPKISEIVRKLKS